MKQIDAYSLVVTFLATSFAVTAIPEAIVLQTNSARFLKKKQGNTVISMFDDNY
ncbi:hypothetical protein LCY76_06420 [Fictibacillus sp. KIGAM418]|uniref:Uncharacterized protein n=1 Tax=Fictibacillus marinisediminis TaxID=2878389 RepID=A0A9X1XAH6_9BACL|nr:hypothetical protein [Fictibacillus marinisediminis]MCK6256235.1 hypothetical protein [Fictibacillus marinisediminis]